MIVVCPGAKISTVSVMSPEAGKIVVVEKVLSVQYDVVVVVLYGSLTITETVPLTPSSGLMVVVDSAVPGPYTVVVTLGSGSYTVTSTVPEDEGLLVAVEVKVPVHGTVVVTAAGQIVVSGNVNTLLVKSVMTTPLGDVIDNMNL